MGMGINIDAGSVGERIVIGLAVLGLVLEMLSDNCHPMPEPISIETCRHEICEPYPISSYDRFSCECAVVEGD